jgi:hypothetical protein
LGRKITFYIVPIIFASAYAILFPYAYITRETGGFSSLSDVSDLLNMHPQILLSAWLHFLAFDLLMGHWITDDAHKNKIRHVYIAPSLFLTFMFGPLG